MSSIHGEKSYSLTTTKTPNGDISYGRILFDDCIHHYVISHDNWVMFVEIYDLKDNIIFWGDEIDIDPEKTSQKRPTRSHAIKFTKGILEYHLNDDYPLWRPTNSLGVLE